MNTDRLATRLFGQTRQDALDAGICIRCKLPPDLASMSLADRREYAVTAICPTCWVDLFPEDDPNR